MQLSKKENSEFLSLKIVPIKPFKNISIGDPYYFEDLDAEERVPGTIDKKQKKVLEELTLDTKTTCCKKGVMAIAEIEEDLGFDNERFSYIVLDIALSSRNTYEEAMKDFEVYLTDRCYKNSVKKSHELACDTARFEICVDGRFDEVHTGADGYYGYANELKQYYGFQISLTFDSSLFTVEDIEEKARYWFEVDKKKENDPMFEQLKETVKTWLEEQKANENVER